MTLGNAAAACVRIIVWRKSCEHQSRPIPPRWLLGTATKRPCSMARAADLFQNVAAVKSIWS
jgi:hypothetical protein